MRSVLALLPPLSNDHIFQSSALVLPVWALLLVAPRWGPTRRLAAAVLVALCLIYGALLMAPLASAGFLPLVEQMTSWSGVLRFFRSSDNVLLAWFHLAIVDLTTALWLLADAQMRRIHGLAMVPVMAAAFVCAPAGVLLHVAVVRPLLAPRKDKEGLPSSRFKRD